MKIKICLLDVARRMTPEYDGLLNPSLHLDSKVLEGSILDNRRGGNHVPQTGK